MYNQSPQRSTQFQQEDRPDNFNYEITFQKLDMTFLPKNALLSLSLKRGQNLRESNRKFYMNEISKQAVINEAYSFNSAMVYDAQKNRYKDKFIDVQVNQWKGDQSTPIGELRINLGASSINGEGQQIHTESLQKCSDPTAKLSYQVKFQRKMEDSFNFNSSNQDYQEQRISYSSVSPPRQFQNSSPLSTSFEANNSNGQNRSFAYKHHSELSPTQPKRKDDQNESIESRQPTKYHLNSSSQSSSYAPHSIQPAPQPIQQPGYQNQPQPQQQQYQQQREQQQKYQQQQEQGQQQQKQQQQQQQQQQQDESNSSSMNMSNLSQKNVGKKGIITLNKDNKQNKKFILPNNQKKQPSTTVQRTPEQPNSSRISSNSREKAKQLGSSISSNRPSTSSTSNYSSMKQKINKQISSKSPEQSSKLTTNNLTPRAVTPTPTPKPIASPINSANKKKDIGYRERSAEQTEHKLQYQVSQEKREQQQKQQVPTQRKFIIEGKKREQAKGEIKDIQNSQLAQKLTSLLHKKEGDQQQYLPQDKQREGETCESRGNQNAIKMQQPSYSQFQGSHHPSEQLEEEVDGEYHNDQSIESEKIDSNQNDERRDLKIERKFTFSPHTSDDKPTLKQQMMQYEQSKLNNLSQRHQQSIPYTPGQQQQQQIVFPLEFQEMLNELYLQKQKLEEKVKTLSAELADSQNQITKFYQKESSNNQIGYEQINKEREKINKDRQQLQIDREQLSIDREQFTKEREIFRAENDQLRRITNDAYESTNLLKSQSDFQEQQIKQHLEKINALAEQNKLLQQQNNNQQEALFNKQKELDQVKLQIGQQIKSQSLPQVESVQLFAQQVKSLTSQNLDLSSKLKQQQNTVFEYQSLLSKQEAIIQNLQSTNGNSTSKDTNEASKKEIDSLKKEIERLNNEINRLEGKLSDTIEKLKKQDSLIIDLKSHVQSLEEAIEGKQKEFEFIKKQAEDKLNQLHQEKEEKANKLNEVIQKITVEKQFIEHQTAMKMQDQDEKAAELTALIEDSKDSTEKIQKYYEMYQGQLDKVKELQSQLNEVNKAFQQKQTESEQKNIDIMKREKEILRNNQIIADQKQQINSINEHLEAVTQQLEQEIDKSQSNNQQQEVEQNIQLSGVLEKLQNVQADFNKAKQEIKRLNDCLQQQNEESQLWVEEKQMLEEDIISLREQLQKTQQQAQNAAQRKIDIILQEKENLEQELKSLQIKYQKQISSQSSLHNSLIASGSDKATTDDTTHNNSSQIKQLEKDNKQLLFQYEQAISDKQKCNKSLEAFKQQNSSLLSNNTQLQAFNSALELNLLSAKQDFCEALNVIFSFEKGGNELFDQIEQAVSFKELKSSFDI